MQLQTAITTLKKKYGSAATFLVTFNKDRQTQVAAHPQRAYLGTAPSLAMVRSAYSAEIVTTWIMAQLEDVNDFAGTTVKMSLEQMEQVAGIISVEYYYFKVTELLLFFHRMKTGSYGYFYGTVDPLKIMTSLKLFAEERRHEIRSHEQRQYDNELSIKREEWKQTAVTREEYNRMKAEKEAKEKRKTKRPRINRKVAES